ncbi:MAG: hypothetical protein J1F11_10860 [Oscillospiraceae bacterium]|nr:hypothetical protein [Oscillospiraceae bacterium]
MTAMTMLMGISALNEVQSARSLEMIMPLAGVILMTPVFHPEQDENIRDVVRSKRTSYLAVCVLRVIYSVFFLGMLCGGFVCVMGLCESAVTVRHFVGGFASGLFLGTVGFFFAGLGRSVIVGYMASLIYYIANYAFGRGIVFDLFSMTTAADFYDVHIIAIKYLLIAAAVLMIVLCFVIMRD